ncbi:carbohydrate kinase [Arachidicoccus ginsenosidimutans]|uniref:bifunctional heptose 7-phosphate kinase/heptose 1-phosphate adenyltransferase n=1 Tax=Arachidicoccus sp. BS20 TaxID=1850526 RepID=UPI0007F04EA6|nr:bifunctional ADP-heptose synthase [Arachidicoccus sp. BS20]ANI89474.1 carbohydrate kinase [Arachidicoccus sp. BS20]
MTIQEIFNSFSTLKVAVLGDIMLDTYCWGNIERISPEAPVPIVALEKEEYRIGGAGNVALNLTALGANVDVFSVSGDDVQAKTLLKLMSEKNIGTENIIKISQRPTTNKMRIIARNQQVMRLDSEVTTDINEGLVNELLEKLSSYIAQKQPQLLILEDYNKGVLTKSLIEKSIALAKANNVIVTVDPKHKNFFAYQNADIFKPNLKEVKEALHISQDKIDAGSLSAIHQSLREKLQHQISFITLSEKGVFFQQKDNLPQIIPAKIRNIADVSGAGDTVIAVLSAVYTITGNILFAAEIANIAGGLVCETVGTVAIDKEQLLKECSILNL